MFYPPQFDHRLLLIISSSQSLHPLLLLPYYTISQPPPHESSPPVSPPAPPPSHFIDAPAKPRILGHHRDRPQLVRRLQRSFGVRRCRVMVRASIDQHPNVRVQHQPATARRLESAAQQGTQNIKY